MNLQESIRNDINILEAPLELTSDPNIDYEMMADKILACDILVINDHLFWIGDVYISKEELEEWQHDQPFLSVAGGDHETDRINLSDIKESPLSYEFYITKKMKVV